ETLDRAMDTTAHKLVAKTSRRSRNLGDHDPDRVPKHGADGPAVPVGCTATGRRYRPHRTSRPEIAPVPQHFDDAVLIARTWEGKQPKRRCPRRRSASAH